jgi:hypothetical protein
MITRKSVLIAVLLACLAAVGSAQTNTQILQQIRTVFVIALENHNLAQTNPTSSPQQLKGNPAAPFLNSLITPGNSNAVQVSYATRYYNAGSGVHPSEPNYVWAEAGTTFSVLTDNDPSTNSGNIFDAPHLTRQLNSAGIPWKNYQEDLEFSTGPTVSASGTSSNAANLYNGSPQYGYAVKHNPMAFFSDTQTQNVYPLAQFFTDLTNNAVGQYNWITPNLYNDMHGPLSGGFTYNGVVYTGDQAAVAQGDNFLSIVIPRIMASQAYQNNGLIILWGDEAEGDDTTNSVLPEIVISPLARGNAYASCVVMSHSSDLRTVEEIFGLSCVTNAIPAGEVAATGGYNDVTSVNDLSDLFLTIPATSILKATNSGGTNGVMLSWPTNATRFTLQKNCDLTTTNWVGVTNMPVTVYDQNQVTIAPLTNQAFFRLK